MGICQTSIASRAAVLNVAPLATPAHLALTRSMSRPSADTCAFGAPHMFCVYSSK